MLALGAATAHAQSPPRQVTPQLALDGLEGTVDSQLRDQSCAELKFGPRATASPRSRARPTAATASRPGPPPGAPAGLPHVVPFKTETESFNRRHWFATTGGRVYFRSNTLETGIRQPW